MDVPALIPLPPNRVWRTYLGGALLDARAGKSNPVDSHFPEDWIASTTRAVNPGRENLATEGLSMVTVGEHALTLKELMEQHPESMVGAEHFRRYGANTQVLLKFLDTSIRLHLQAHPTRSFARAHFGVDAGKTEAYLILATRPEVAEPYIYLGFQNPPSSEAFEHAVCNEDVDTMLSWFERIPVKVGDVFIVPGGMPHAIGEGIFMIEIMEPTDFVVRLERERGGYRLPESARFMGRDVGLATAMIDFAKTPTERVREKHFCRPRLLRSEGGGEELALIGSEQTDCFSVNFLRIAGTMIRQTDTFYIGVVIRGSGCVRADGMSLPLKEGAAFLVPFRTRSVTFESDEALEIAIVFKELA